MNSRKYFAIGATLALALLAGCGSSNTNQSGGNTNDAAIQQQDQQQQPANGGGQGMNRAPVDLVGKVKSIAGNTLTVYKSSFTPGQNGGGRMGQGQGGGQQPANGQQGNGQPPAGGAGGGRGQMSFTEETVDIAITDNTKLIKREFVNNQPQDTELTLADLKTDDIVSVDLQDGTQEAVTITLGMGGGGFGGGGGQRGQGQAQQQDQSQDQSQPAQ
jgi:hypothetical protein